MTTEPFAWGRRLPLPLLLISARMPLVRASQHHFELRDDYLAAARNVPGLYLAGIDLTLMGGQPYSDWN